MIKEFRVISPASRMELEASLRQQPQLGGAALKLIVVETADELAARRGLTQTQYVFEVGSVHGSRECPFLLGRLANTDPPAEARLEVSKNDEPEVGQSELHLSAKFI